MDMTGRYVGHREIDKVIVRRAGHGRDILEKVRASAEPVRWTEEEGGIEYFRLGVYLKDLDWVVVLSRPTNEIYTYFYSSIRRSVALTLITCVVAIVLGVIWVKRMLVPIRLLHEQVPETGKGSPDYQAGVATGYEIGDHPQRLEPSGEFWEFHQNHLQ